MDELDQVVERIIAAIALLCFGVVMSLLLIGCVLLVGWAVF